MLRKIAFILAIICMLSLIGCNNAKENDPSPKSDKIEVGEKDGVAYFNRSEAVPEIVLVGSDKKIEDTEFFANLVSAIDGKKIIGVCDCMPVCSISIDKYIFRLKKDAIELFEKADDENKFVGMVECPREKMNDMLEALGYVENTDKP